LAALTAARTTGEGRDMDVSLFDMALANTNYVAAWYLNEGHRQERLPRSAHPSLAPCQLYPTNDGWIFIMCNKEKFWPVLCELVERPDWIGDARFSKFADRLTNREVLTEYLDAVLASRSTADWLSRFAGRVPAAPVNNIAEALDNPFVSERGGLQTINHPSVGEYRLVAPPVRSAETPPSRPAPAFGEHTDALLTELGYDQRRLQELRALGVI
jgi:crotonobetainyl-CoA:carnitine CoA-transferase CaiB-like acyl-CoA transferase